MHDTTQAILDMPNDLPFESTVGQPLQKVLQRPESDADSRHMAGRLESREAVQRFLEAGRARFTVRSKATGARFTYRASRPKEEPGRSRPIWISVLTGADNESAYEFLGTVWPSPNGYSLRRSAKSRIGVEAPSSRAFDWLLKALNGASRLEQAEVWHEGACGRCGRTLTVPESISSGFGPECLTRL